jgi:hypothetical protein
MAWISMTDLGRWFGGVIPDEEAEGLALTPGERKMLLELREGAGCYAELILHDTPPCADQSAAIRALRESLHWARESVLDGARRRAREARR